MKVIFFLFFLLCLITDLQAQSDKIVPDSSSMFIGKEAPFFEIATVDDKKYNLSELKGKIVVLNFWFIGCAPCKKEIPHLNSLVTENAQRKDIVFLAISNIDNQEALQFIQKKWGMKFELIAKGQVVADAYKVGLYPTNFVIDGNGKIVFKKIGYSEIIKQEIQEVINRL